MEELEKRDKFALYLSKREKDLLKEQNKKMNCGMTLNAYIRYKLFANEREEKSEK